MIHLVKKMYKNVWSIALMLTLGTSSPLQAEPLTPTELHATLGIVTNFILSDDTNKSVSHNGVIYGTVTSPYTGRVWLDRNLGASQVCTSFDDIDCYGDYYQWGRNADGHENRTSTTTNVQAVNVNDAGNLFITASGINRFDWAQIADASGSIRLNNLAKTDGTSVCPIGFRVPSFIEISAEILDVGTAEITNSADAFSSFLKLPSGGYRAPENGIYYNENSGTGAFNGSIWSNTINDDLVNDNRMKSPFWSSGFVGVSIRAYRRSSGRAIRCIKN